jgi:uncharacterized membrane protein
MCTKRRLQLICSALLAAPISVAWIAPSRADWQICNRSAHEADVAIGHFKDGEARSNGWYRVSGCGCQNVWNGNMNGQTFYYFAHAPGGEGDWEAPPGGNSNMFCVNTASKFDYGRDFNEVPSRCEKVPGTKLHNFYQLQMTAGNWTTNLTFTGPGKVCF